MITPTRVGARRTHYAEGIPGFLAHAVYQVPDACRKTRFFCGFRRQARTGRSTSTQSAARPYCQPTLGFRCRASSGVRQDDKLMVDGEIFRQAASPSSVDGVLFTNVSFNLQAELLEPFDLSPCVLPGPQQPARVRNDPDSERHRSVPIAE